MSRHEKKTLFRNMLLASMISMCSTQLSWGANPAEPGAGADSSPNSAINKVLLEEQQGKPIDRFTDIEAWKSNQSAEPSDSMRWQTGELKADGAWIECDQLKEEGLSPKIKRYRKLKSETTLDLAGHRKLAVFCEEQKLKEQAESHWYGVLEFDPQNAQARNALGFVQFANRWISRNEMLMAREINKSTAEACKKWAPTVRKWALAIDGTDSKKRLAAIRELKEVDDPSIVHAAFLAVPHVSPTTAAHLVQTICRFRTREAAQALASIAVQDLATEASQIAVEGLKQFPPESYVPDLLDLMSVESTLQEQVVTRPNGALVLQLVQERESRNSRSMDWFDKQLWAPIPARKNSPSKFKSPSSSSTTTRSDNSMVITRQSSQTEQTNIIVAPNELVRDATQREADRVTGAMKAQQERENAAIRSRQKAISSVLRGLTGADLKDDARQWWAWWDQNQESYLVSDKPVNYGYQVDNSNPIYQPEYLLSTTTSVEQTYVAPPPPAVRPTRHDCLVAGTMISTETGLVPIQQISVGDRVLSQDIKTGELSLKPVLRIATRPPAPTRIIKLSTGEELRCTLGHPWWVIGQGWVKSKDLSAGMHLRTPKSTVEIIETVPGEEIRTHNLVVADSSSYFAGTDRVLSYDGNEVVHTFQRVPGLPAVTQNVSKLVAAD